MSEKNENKEHLAVGSDSNEGLGGARNFYEMQHRIAELIEDKNNIETMLYDTLLERDQYKFALVKIRDKRHPGLGTSADIAREALIA